MNQEAQEWYREYARHYGEDAMTMEEVIAYLVKVRETLADEHRDMISVAYYLHALKDEEFLRAKGDWRETMWLAEIAEKMATAEEMSDDRESVTQRDD